MCSIFSGVLFLLLNTVFAFAFLKTWDDFRPFLFEVMMLQISFSLLPLVFFKNHVVVVLEGLLSFDIKSSAQGLFSVSITSSTE